MFLPYYSIGDTVGRSDRYLREFWGIHISDGLGTYAVGDGELLRRFNPYRDLSYGGTTLGFRGKNYWFPDGTWIGKILKALFYEKK